jgi:hypothetical protein
MTNLIQQSRPSYSQGFARSAGESANPGLWEDQYISYYPSIGNLGVSTPCRDLSGNSNHATTFDIFASNWVVYKGNLSVVVDFEVVQTPTITHGIGTGDFTWMTWAYSNTLSAYTPICANGSFSPGMYISINNGAWGMYWGGDHAAPTGSTLSTNTWYHLCVARIKGVLYFYENGKAVGSKAKTTSMSDSVFTFGRNGTGGDGLKGGISYLSCWSRGLTISEIQQLYVDSLAPLRLRQSVFLSTEEEEIIGRIMSSLANYGGLAGYGGIAGRGGGLAG